MVRSATNNGDNNNENPLNEFAGTGVYFLRKGYNDDWFSDPVLPFRLTLYNTKVTNILCNLNYTGVGLICTLSVRQESFNSTSNSADFNIFYVKVDILSSGSVKESTPININLNKIHIPLNSFAYNNGWQVNIMSYGSYLLIATFLDKNNNINIYTYYCDEYSGDPTPWELSEPTVLNPRGIYMLLPNNTMLVAKQGSLNSWGFITTDIPKFNNEDNNYSNAHVHTTNPQINSSIQASEKEITITYYEPVELSAGNISIYLIDNDGMSSLQ